MIKFLIEVDTKRCEAPRSVKSRISKGLHAFSCRVMSIENPDLAGYLNAFSIQLFESMWITRTLRKPQ